MQKPINESSMMRFESSFDGIEFCIDNTEPSIFEVGRHYTFDVVMGIWFGDYSTYDERMLEAINSLTTSGYTEEWFAHYVYGFDIGYYDAASEYHNFSPEQYYIPQSETVIYYGNTFYSELTDIVHSGSSSILNHSQNRLYMQVKMHFDFDCVAPIDSFSAMWMPYQFSPLSTGGAAIFQTTFDISNIISYDYTAIQGMNMIALDIKSQIAGMESSLTSSLQQLLDQQDRYWDLLLGGYENSNYDLDFGILYEILDMQHYIGDYASYNYTTLTKINGSVSSIKSTVSTISSNTSSIKQLLNGTTKTFWDFLEGNFDVLHEDLVDIKNYLDQTDKSSDINSTVNESIGSMMQVANPGDLSLNNVSVPELANEGSWNWFSQTVDLIDFTLPFLTLALAFGVFKAVFS